MVPVVDLKKYRDENNGMAPDDADLPLGGLRQGQVYRSRLRRARGASGGGP